jgi:hypothetical protein
VQADPAAPGHLDVVIVGAGLSGIGAAVHLQGRLPGKTYAILEACGAIGGTWDLFRYPGIRSDSDMYTLGYAFKPWTDAKAIADGPSIRAYIEDTARENDIDPHIRCDQRLIAARWSTAEARWTLDIARGDETIIQTCNFLLMCSGYYAYKRAYRPEWPGRGGVRRHHRPFPILARRPRDDRIDAQRRAQPRADLRLHQRVVDIEGRPHQRLILPPPRAHGPLRRAHRHPPRACRHRTGPSPPATSSARSIRCPGKAPPTPGASARTTSPTSPCSASAASKSLTSSFAESRRLP